MTFLGILKQFQCTRSLWHRTTPLFMLLPEDIRKSDLDIKVQVRVSQYSALSESIDSLLTFILSGVKAHQLYMIKKANFTMDPLLGFTNASTKQEKNIHGHIRHEGYQIFATNSIISLTGTVSNHGVSMSCSTCDIFLLMSLHPRIKHLPF